MEAGGGAWSAVPRCSGKPALVRAHPCCGDDQELAATAVGNDADGVDPDDMGWRGNNILVVEAVAGEGPSAPADGLEGAVLCSVLARCAYKSCPPARQYLVACGKAAWCLPAAVCGLVSSAAAGKQQGRAGGPQSRGLPDRGVQLNALVPSGDLHQERLAISVTTDEDILEIKSQNQRAIFLPRQRWASKVIWLMFLTLMLVSTGAQAADDTCVVGHRMRTNVTLTCPARPFQSKRLLREPQDWIDELDYALLHSIKTTGRIEKSKSTHCHKTSWIKDILASVGLLSNLVPNIAPAMMICCQSGMDNQCRMWILTISTFSFSTANVFWALFLWGQQCWDKWNFSQCIVVLIINLGYMCYFWNKACQIKWSNVMRTLLCILAVLATAVVVGVLKKIDVAGSLGITFTIFGHVARLVSAGTAFSPERSIFTGFGVLGGCSMFFYKFIWTDERLYKIGTIISLSSRGIDIFVMIFYHWQECRCGQDLARNGGAPVEGIDHPLAQTIQMVAIEPDVAIDGERTTEHTQSTTESGNALEGSTAVPSTEPKDEKPTPAPVLVPSTEPKHEKPTPAPVLVPSTPTQCLTGQGVPSLPVASGSTQSAQGCCNAQKRCEQKNEEASLTQMVAVPSISKCPPTQGVPPALPLSDSTKREASAAHSVSQSELGAVAESTPPGLPSEKCQTSS